MIHLYLTVLFRKLSINLLENKSNFSNLKVISFSGWGVGKMSESVQRYKFPVIK